MRQDPVLPLINPVGMRLIRTAGMASPAELSITEVTTMLNEETRRKLREMNFGELVDALDLQEKQAEYLALPFDDRINLAVDYAYSAK